MTTPAQHVPVSLIIVTHNSADFVGEVISEVQSDSVVPDEILVIDNASTDDTLEILADFDITIIAQDTNTGFANACHTGVDNSHNDIVVFLGHDTVPRPGWLLPLVDALGSATVGAAMATVEDADHPGTFNTSGGHLTYYGMGWISDAGMPILPEPIIVDVAYPSGAAMALHRQTWFEFSGFREEFFMYQEDADLGWRLRLGGLRTVRATRSRVLHRYDFNRSPDKMFYLERNRWLMLRSNYRRSTLLILTPALVLVELGTTLVAIRDGWFNAKRRAWQEILRAGPILQKGRKLSESHRAMSDRKMIMNMDYKLSTMTQIPTPAGTGIADLALGAWKRVALFFLYLLDRFQGVG